MNFELDIYCDGGYDSTLKQFYGSFKCYEVKENSNIDIKLKEHIKIYFDGVKTSNEAEYRILNDTLDWVCKNYGLNIEINIFSDSQLVVRQINEYWRIEAKHLKPYYENIIDLKYKFKDFNLVWVPRKFIVKILGH